MAEIQDGRYSSGLYKRFCPHMFGCPLYIQNTKKACFVRLRGCPYASIHLDAPICLNAPCMLGQPHIFRCPICLDDVWMHPVHTQHKERMLWQTKGVSICLHTFGWPLYTHNTKKGCFDRLRGCLYAPIHLDAPICLDAPCMFRCHHMFGCTPCMFGCPHKCWCPTVCLDTPHVCTSHMFGCPYVWTLLCMVGCPHMFGHPPVWLDALYVWLPHCMFGCCQMYGSI